VSRRRAGLIWIALFGVYAATLGVPAADHHRYAGDEPHYLLMARSIASDGDVDLSDEFARREYRSFYSGTLRTNGRVIAGRLVEPQPAGVSALLGLMVHSFFDGLSIGSGFVIGRALGLLLFAAILLHKAPEGFAIASVVLAARGTRRQAILAAGAVGLATLVGGLAIFGERTLVGPALAVSAGVTLYVAASDLVPEVNREQGTAVALTVFAGVVLYYVTERLLSAAGI